MKYMRFYLVTALSFMGVVFSSCYRVAPLEELGEDDGGTFKDDIENGVFDTQRNENDVPGEEEASHDVAADPTKPENDGDYIFKVEQDELDQLVMVNRLVFYYYNTHQSYFRELDVELNPPDVSSDKPHSVNPPSDRGFCVFGDPLDYNIGAGWMVEFPRDENGRPIPIDASEYIGIGFWSVRDSEANQLIVCVPDVNTHPDGEVCDVDYACHEDWCVEVPLKDQWTFNVILFEELIQNGPTNELDVFRQSEIYGVKFQTPLREIGNFCVDEIFFVR